MEFPKKENFIYIPDFGKFHLIIATKSSYVHYMNHFIVDNRKIAVITLTRLSGRVMGISSLNNDSI